MQLGTWLHTLLRGQLVGTDESGNRYYEDRRAPKTERNPKPGASGGHSSSPRAKRWVLYKGVAEPTKVPPIWHRWLHYTSDAIPQAGAPKPYEWVKDPLPNLTGTEYAYRPPGHLLKGGKRAASFSDYEAWKP